MEITVRDHAAKLAEKQRGMTEMSAKFRELGDASKTRKRQK
jgi:hypothetical protein